MSLVKIHFQRGLFEVEIRYYNIDEDVPFDNDKYNKTILCKRTDILGIRKTKRNMMKHYSIDETYMDLYPIEE